MKKGILHFKDSNTYLKYLDKLSKGEEVNFGNFESYATVKSNLQKEMESEKFRNQSKKEFQNWLEKNSKFIQFEDESIRFVNENYTEAQMINKEYIVYIGKILHKFTNAQQVIVLDGTTTRLEEEQSNFVKIHDRINTTSKNQKVALNCTIVSNKKMTNGNRRSRLYVTPSTSYFPSSGGLYNYAFQSVANTISERNWLIGGWLTDQTDQIFNPNYTMKILNFNAPSGYPPKTLNFSHVNGTYSSSSYSIASGILTETNVIYGGCGFVMEFPSSGSHKLLSHNVTNSVDCVAP